MHRTIAPCAMQLDVPSLHWGTATSATASAASNPPPTPPFLPSLSEEYEVTPGSSNLALQGIRTQLQVWATRRLGQQHPDASLVLIHHQLLEQMRRQGSVPSRGRPVWWRLALPDTLPVGKPGSGAGEDEAQPAATMHAVGGAMVSGSSTAMLAAALFHLSGSEDDAWVALARALWHGMAVPSGAALGAM